MGVRKRRVLPSEQQEQRRQRALPAHVVQQQRLHGRDPFADARYADSVGMMREVAGGLRHLSRAMRPLAENNVRMAETVTAEARKRRRMEELDDDDLAAIRAFSGRTNLRDIQSFWKKAPYIETAASRKWRKAEAILKSP